MAIEVAESLRFRCEGLAGYISGGHEHGVELTGGHGHRPVTMRMCMNVEQYYARSQRGGRFFPRYRADVTTERVGTEALRVTIAPFGDWAVESIVTFRLREERVIEAEYEFR